MSVRPWVWVAPLAFVLPSCGLTLDYGPPDPVAMDGGALADASMGTCETGCDDGLRCTADECVDDACVHTDTCPDATDCVLRGSVGECRRACASGDDCNDGIDCTQDLCLPDHHCAHTNECLDPRPVCLANGHCAPTICAADADCTDGDACDGIEHCVMGACRVGTPVVCDAPPTGCVHQECDSDTGACVDVRDTGHCDDGLDCTADLCRADGSCENPPNDAFCDDGNLCATRVCNPAGAIDATGCVTNGGVVCASPCIPAGATLACDPSTGLCDFDSVCPVGQVCRAGGCHTPNGCSSDDSCLGTIGPDGCITHCIGGTCQTVVCARSMGCGDLVVDGLGCTGGACNYVPNDERCDDGLDLTTDRCNPTTFACEHTCPPARSDQCVSFTFDGMQCVPTLDSATCARLHPSTGAGCARWQCVGDDPAAGGGNDGCALVGVDAACDDGATCTDETCIVDATSGTGTCRRMPDANAGAICDDAQDCTVDACDPAHADVRSTTGCTHTPDDAVCRDAAGSTQCATAFCAQTGSLANMLGSATLPTGCAVDYRPADCGLLASSICTLDGSCQVVRCTAGATTCDDRNPCNGMESCLLGHCLQTTLSTTRCTASSPDCMAVCTSMGCVAPMTIACGAAVDAH